MIEWIFNLIDNYGEFGLYLSFFIEGTALPLIGTFIVISYGFLIDLSLIRILSISVFGALLYTIGSWIPYYIGYYLDEKMSLRLKAEHKEKLIKVKDLFARHGVWSIVISSPLPLGNMVPFAAGISNVHIFRYSLLTFLGIAPTTFLYLLLGQLVPITTNELIVLINRYQLILMTTIFVSLFLYSLIKRKRAYNDPRKRKQKDSTTSL
ncbi:DedA family protein [Cytobacillus sp. FJAT-54145]|uniref:DedA family protein n=1 Tax=Cytobacillus spartinae TaxID=3299023 RepID=A0ABW6KDR1_9BACI